MNQVANFVILAFCQQMSFLSAEHFHLRRDLHVATSSVTEVKGEGCCFEIGYGDMMVPCCLKVEKSKSEEECPIDEVSTAGGGTGWSEECPANAEKAAQVIAARRKAAPQTPSDPDSEDFGSSQASLFLMLPA